jgi:hypothetical protein
MVSAVERVIKSYAAQNNLDVSTIRLVSSEQVDWPDGCLGVAKPGMMCIQVITPGYRIILEVNGRAVELHSTISGDYYVEAPAGSNAGFPLK